MIVADSDLISYFWLEAGRTEAARQVRRRDPEWAALFLWRSEFRNVLFQHMAFRDLPYEEALEVAQRAERDMRGAEHHVATSAVLKLSSQAHHPAYDREYVALAQALGVTLVTGDWALPELFPDTTVSLEDFAGSKG